MSTTTIITDHEPLVSILKPSKTLPTLTAARMLNYANFLSGFNYDIKYRSKTYHDSHSDEQFLNLAIKKIAINCVQGLTS